MLKRILHWGWWLFELVVLVLLLLFILVQGSVYFFQSYPQKSSALIQQYLGIELSYQQANIQQNWFGFEVSATQLKVQQQGVHFQAEQLVFDIDLHQLFLPGLFIGDSLTLRNAQLTIPPFYHQQASQDAEIANLLPKKLWREMSIANFDISSKIQPADEQPLVPVTLSFQQIQSRLGVKWLLNGDLSLYLSANKHDPVACLSFQGDLNASEAGLVSDGQFSWQFRQPLDLQWIQPLLSKAQQAIFPVGQMAVDGEAEIKERKLVAVTTLVHLQQLQWPKIQQDQILPKSLAVQVQWLQDRAHHFLLENLRIDNRYIGHKDLAEVVLSPDSFQFKMSTFNSAPFEPIVQKALQVYLKVPAKTLAKQPPHIDIESIEFGLNRQSWNLDNLNLQINQLSLPPLMDYPGVELKQTLLQKLGQQYRLKMVKPIMIQYPRVFENPLALNLQGGIQFVWSDQGQQLSLPSTRFKVNDIPFQLSWQSKGMQVQKGVLSASPQNLQQVKDLLPYPLMPKDLQQWLKESLVAGEQIQVEAKLSGNLKQFPFKDGGGQFNATADIQNTTLKFQPDWPALTDFTAHLNFHPYDLTITTPVAKLMGLQASKVKVVIANLGQEDIAVDIQGGVEGDAAEAQQLLLNSPLAKKIGLEDFLQQDAQLSGKVGVDLKKIWVPVHGFAKRETDVQAAVSFNQVDLTLYNRLALKGIEGKLTIHNKEVKAPNLVGTLMEAPFSAKIETDSKQNQIVIFAKGALEMPKTSQVVAGYLNWQHQVTVPYDERPFKMETQIGFDKFHSRLPAPLDQSFFSTGPAVMYFEKQKADGKLAFEVGKKLKAKGLLKFQKDEGSNAEVIQALSIAIGEQVLPKSLEEVKGVQFKGRLEQLDIDGWLQRWSEVKPLIPVSESKQEWPITFAPSELSFDSVQFKTHAYHNIRFTLQDLPDQRLVFKLGNSNEIDIQGLKKEGKWFLQTNKLHIQLPEATKSAEKPQIPQSCQFPFAVQEPLLLSPIHFEGKDIQWGQRRFNQVRFDIEPTQVALLLKGLNFRYGKANGTGNYQWLYATQKSRLKIAIRSKSVTDFSRMLDIEKGIKGKKAVLNLEGNWAGGPQCFSLEGLHGQLNVRFDDGVIKDVEPGVARLLGLLSINSIIRRLSLDLSDVTSEGLAYSVIETSGMIEKGILKLKDFRLDAPSVRAKLWGQIDLIHKKFHLDADVTPAVGSSLATIAAFVGAVNPVTAILTFTLLKNIPEINEDLVTYQYKIRGDWDKPVIKSRSVEKELIEN